MVPDSDKLEVGEGIYHTTAPAHTNWVPVASYQTAPLPPVGLSGITSSASHTSNRKKRGTRI